MSQAPVPTIIISETEDGHLNIVVAPEKAAEFLARLQESE